MKQAFTLMEILITITIFSFIVISLYKVINTTKTDIDSISLVADKQLQDNYQRTILMEDFIESKEISIETKDENSIVNLKSNNTYHNSLYMNILYILHKGNLYRVESLKKISKDTINSIDNKNLFIDLIYSNIVSFIVEKGKENNYLIYIKNKTNKEIVISIPYSMND